MMVEVLKRIGLEGGDVDPCIYMKRDKNGVIYVALYLYDNLLIRDEKAIKETMKALKKAGLLLKVYDSLDDYLSCEIKFTNNGQSVWLEQPHLIDKLKEKFGELCLCKKVVDEVFNFNTLIHACGQAHPQISAPENSQFHV